MPSVNQATTEHDQLQATLDLAGVEMRASEVHGLVCGELCRQLTQGAGTDFPQLIGLSQPPGGAGRAALDAVSALMDESRAALDAGVQFSLLLPEDDEPIDARTASVADWAGGFTLALLRGGAPALEDLAADSAEIVRDLLEISDARPGEDTEEDERALTEIEEYIRVGVQLVFEEMQPDEQPEEP